MVRFSWHVEDGLQAYLPPGAYTTLKDSAVRHAACEIEIPQSKETLEAVLTLPANYLDADKIKETGIVLGHGNEAEEWKGKLLTDIAVHLATQGFLVIRFFCKQKESRRQRMFEKALDACATSPYARGISKWVLAGLGSGGRVAAVVGNRCRGDVAGYVMLSYPLKEPIPQQQGKVRRGDDDSSPPPKSSESPLFEVDKPMLFVLGDSDEFCTLTDLKSIAAQLPCPDIRVELFEDANEEFKSPTQGKGPVSSVTRRLCSCIQEFLTAINEDSLSECKLPKLLDLQQEPGTGQSAGPEPDTTPQQAAVTPSQPASAPALADPKLVLEQPAALQQSVDAAAPMDTSEPGHQPSQAQHPVQPEAEVREVLRQPDPGQQSLPAGPLPHLYQQMLSSQVLQNPQQAQQILTALASQRAQLQQQAPPGSWSNGASSQQQPSPLLQQLLGHLVPEHRHQPPNDPANPQAGQQPGGAFNGLQEQYQARQ